MKDTSMHHNPNTPNIAPPGQTTTPRKIRPMRRLCGLAMAAIGLSAPLASADTTITVQDPSFETPGGTAGGPWAAIAAVWHPTTTWWGQTYDSSFFTSAADGTWFANCTDNPSESITQDLLTTVNSGDTLAVTFYVGREKSNVGGVIAATFIVGTTPYTFDFDATGLAPDTWAPYTLTKTIGNSGNLSLKFKRVSGRPWLDKISNVTVTPAAPPSGEPTSTNATLNAVEDTEIALAAENFGYADPNDPQSPLAAVKITSLPLLGTLKNDGAIVLSGELPLTVAAVDIGKLTYQSATNGNGTPYAWIGIKVKSENNLWSVADADMTVNVTPDNDPPTSTGGSVSMKSNTVKTFAAANFQFSDVDTGDTLGAIKVTTLPATGILNLYGAPVSENDVVSAGDILALTYTPTMGYSGADSFDFQVSDGTAFSADAVMAITITVNQVPASTGGSVTLRMNTVKTFTAANFPFSDADSGDTLSAIKVVTALPAGTLNLGGTPVSLGEVIPVASIWTLTYTPNADYSGPDSFNFQVSDGMDFSADATMAITVTPDILVLNGGFEDPTPHNPNDGTNADWTAGGWAFVGAPWTTSTGNYGRLSQGPVASPQLGNWIMNLCDQGGWVKQDLHNSVNAGDTLSVTFHVMSDTAPGEIAAAFLVGAGPTEYSQTFINPQNNGTWVPYTLTQTIAVTGNLSLRFTQVSGRLWLDNVSNVSVTPGSVVPGSYADWASTNAPAPQAASDDYDHDGVQNGVEYFMGVAKGDLSFTALPTVEIIGGFKTITWPKSATFSGSYVVQISTNLQDEIVPGDGGWTTATSGVEDNGTSVKFTLPDLGPTCFARLKVTPAP
ncbi:MAG: Ig-like domain-containing protein [Verrucomicrobia bacterium]|nr:Ig-like domain-containing protein [Verrucomicrobiota bacterium]